MPNKRKWNRLMRSLWLGMTLTIAEKLSLIFLIISVCLNWICRFYPNLIRKYYLKKDLLRWIPWQKWTVRFCILFLWKQKNPTVRSIFSYSRTAIFWWIFLLLRIMTAHRLRSVISSVSITVPQNPAPIQTIICTVWKRFFRYTVTWINITAFIITTILILNAVNLLYFLMSSLPVSLPVCWQGIWHRGSWQTPRSL